MGARIEIPVEVLGQALDQTISVDDYNQKVSTEQPDAAVVVDADGDGNIDSGDRFVDPTKGELDEKAKADALERMCDIMAPGKTRFKISEDAQKYLDEAAVVGTRGMLQEGVNGQTLLLDPKVTWGKIPFQSHGIFNPETEQCQFNQPGEIPVEKTEAGVQFTTTDSRGTYETTLDLETHNAEEFIIERKIEG
jgi:hypothetical protein